MEKQSAAFYEEKAKELFRSGCNCSQSVLGAFAEEVGLEFDTALKLASSFGGGMGRMRLTCGAASAMLIVAGLKAGYADPDDYEAKKAHYELVQKLVHRFEAECGSVTCRVLLGGNVSDSPVPTPRTAEFYATRPCEKIIGIAARIAAEELL